MTMIRTTHLSKKYGAVPAVEELSLTVNKGEIYGFLGNNGAGKTTTLRMLLGLVRPDSGTIEILGKDIQPGEKMLSRVGAMIESPGFYPNLTARENLMIFAHLLGISKQDQIDRLLEMAGLSAAGDKKVGSFSMGMKQRLGIIRTLIADPELLILDEPTNGLDPNGIVEVRRFLKKLSREREITILLSSHQLSEVELLADRIGILHHGKLLDEITLSDFARSKRRYLRLMVDRPPTAARLLEQELMITDYRVHEEELRIYERLDEAALINRRLQEGDVLVHHLSTIRPTLEDHYIQLTSGGIIS